jgi:hypothetical protein
MGDDSHWKIPSYKWKNLNQAQPGSLHLLPQEELATLLSANYTAMQGMIHWMTHHRSLSYSMRSDKTPNKNVTTFTKEYCMPFSFKK